MRRAVWGIALVALISAFLTNPRPDEFKNYFQTAVLTQPSGGGNDKGLAQAGLTEGLSALFGSFATNMAMTATNRRDYLFFSVYTVKLDEDERMVWVGAFNRFHQIPQDPKRNVAPTLK